MVPGRRSRLRQLHGAALPELTAPACGLKQTKTPERKLRGFSSLIRHRGVTPIWGVTAKKSYGSSGMAEGISGISVTDQHRPSDDIPLGRRCAFLVPACFDSWWSGLKIAVPHLRSALCGQPSRPGAIPAFCIGSLVRYGFAGGPKSSGGRSICGTSILTLSRSTLSGLSSRPVTVIGKAITSTTMIACSPIQGRAPQ
jgi:hypothetical protein